MVSGLRLFARCRGTTAAMAAFVVLAALGRVLDDAVLRPDEASTFSVPWTVVVPMLTGSVVGLTAGSPLRWLEAGADRRLPALRAGHLAILVLLGSAAALIGSWGITGPLSSSGALRNLLGFAGLACLCAWLVGAALAWALPVAFGLVSIVAGTDVGVPRAWAWPIQPDSHAGSWALALCALAVGSTLLVARGARERDDEEQ